MYPIRIFLKMVYRLANLSLIILSMFACQQKEERIDYLVDDLVKERIDSTLQYFIADNIVVGASALVYEKGREVYFNAYGYADREAKVEMSRNTIVTIYSMTKPLTGTALMTLYDKGAFKLDDPLAKYAPEFADLQVAVGRDEAGDWILVPSERPITIADVTRHTAGFSRRADLGLDKVFAEADLLNMETSLEDMATKLSQIPLGYQPGNRWEYGISVDVQAYLVEKLSGRPFHEYMKEQVLDPLGMEETGYFVPESRRNRVAAIYNKTDTSLNRVPDERVHSINYDHWPMRPGGWGLKASIDDYMKFGQMLLDKGTYNGTTILRKETVELMATNHLPAVEDSSWLPTKGRVGFGIDFAVRTQTAQKPDENVGAIGEFFWDGAASTLFWIDPENELVAILFVQIMPFQHKVHKLFRDAVYGELQP